MLDSWLCVYDHAQQNLVCFCNFGLINPLVGKSHCYVFEAELLIGEHPRLQVIGTTERDKANYITT